MQQIVLIVHLMLALGLVGAVLLQRSEGGGLGIGGGGGGGAGGGGLMDARSTANFLTRATAVLAGLFFMTSIGLAVLAGTHSGGGNRSLVTDGAPIGGAAPAPMGAAPHNAGGGTAPAPAADVELPVVPSVPTN